MNQNPCHGMIYKIQEGDTLYSISRSYQIPLGLLLRANPYIDLYNLQIGEEICIPDKKMPSFSCKPETMPECRPIPDPILPAPPDMPSSPVIPSKPVSPPSGCFEYIVGPDDCLSSVLNKFGLTLYELLKENDMAEIFLLPESTLKINCGRK